MLIALTVLSACAPVPHTRPKPTQIDLATAYSTVENMGAMKRALRGQPEAIQKSVGEVWSAAMRTGLSGAFLVAGETFEDAVSATASVLGGGSSAEELRHQPKKGGDIWVCAFLGNTSSTPPAFAVRRIEVDGNAVRVVFSRPKSLMRTPDRNPYLIWANLGPLAPGKYRV